MNTSCEAELYGGVKLDLFVITQNNEINPRSGSNESSGPLAFLGIIDLPFSFILDTVLLPVNAIQDKDSCSVF